MYTLSQNRSRLLCLNCRNCGPVLIIFHCCIIRYLQKCFYKSYQLTTNLLPQYLKGEDFFSIERRKFIAPCMLDLTYSFTIAYKPYFWSCHFHIGLYLLGLVTYNGLSILNVMFNHSCFVMAYLTFSNTYMSYVATFLSLVDETVKPNQQNIGQFTRIRSSRTWLFDSL